MQVCSLVTPLSACPRIAWIRLNPWIAAHPDLAARLLHAA